MHSTCVQAVCTKLCTPQYAFTFPPFLKRLGRKVDGLQPYSADIKNARDYTSIYPHTFNARCLIKRCYLTPVTSGHGLQNLTITVHSWQLTATGNATMEMWICCGRGLR